MNQKGETVAEPKYRLSFPSTDGISLVNPVPGSGLEPAALINAGGKVIASGFDFSGEISEGLVYVKKATKQVFLDYEGQTVLDLGRLPADARVGGFHDGLAKIDSGSEHYYIDRSGKTVLQTSYAQAGDFSEGLAYVPGEGFLDKSGKLAIVQKDYVKAYPFKEGLAKVEYPDRTYSYIDKSGTVLTDRRFTRATGFSSGLAGVSEGEGFRYIHPNGENAGTVVWEDGREYSEGLAAVKKGGKWGYIDPKGQLVIEAKYEEAFPFRNGLAVVYTGTDSGQDTLYIDREGKVVRPKLEGSPSS
ncbi:WG repeat-containing protein [Paenibacillus sp. CC-CFT747]|nr:WG repeat-containing protein [Paenibacillus sp. CC-CFT747]